MALGVVAVALVLPFLPFARWFGFVAPPPLFFVYLTGATAAYLALVEICKAFFYRKIAPNRA
jgi:Mg2+-importing ATPase